MMAGGVWVTFAIAPVIAALGILMGLLYSGVDRVLAARMQSRVGPPLLQPFRDVAKLMIKETIVPINSVKWLFNSAPIIALASVLLILLYLPIGPIGPILEGHGDLILVVYLFIFPALALVLGGFSSGSPYATVGSQREMIMMVGYEFPLAITVISIAWLISTKYPGLNAFSISVISEYPVWTLVGPVGFTGLLMLLLALLSVASGQVGVVPFDLPEADTEIAGGVLAEYSGRNLALFYLANAVKSIAIGSLIVAIFLPWGLSGLCRCSYPVAVGLDMLFFLAKLFVVVFIVTTFMKVATARLRISRVIDAYWVLSTLVATIALALIYSDACLLS